MTAAERFQMLLDCYLSGQMSPRQWQEHITKEPRFKQWLARTGRSALL